MIPRVLLPLQRSIILTAKRRNFLRALVSEDKTKGAGWENLEQIAASAKVVPRPLIESNLEVFILGGAACGGDWIKDKD